MKRNHIGEAVRWLVVVVLTLTCSFLAVKRADILASSRLKDAVEESIRRNHEDRARMNAELRAEIADIKKALGIHEPEPKGERQNTSANSTFELRR